MAQKSGDNINQFTGGLDKSLVDAYEPKNSVIHARNAINVSSTGDKGSKQGEPGNSLLANAPYTIIGQIYLYDDWKIVCSTNDTDCEVGLFSDSTGEYIVKVNDPGFNWRRTNLITGIARRNFDCTYSFYFSDSHRNPDRALNLDNIPYKGVYSLDLNGCQVFTPNNPLQLDTDKIKLNRNVNIPCIKAAKGSGGGTLQNGTYYAVPSYTVDGQRVTDYLRISNPVSIFAHDGIAGSVEFTLTGLDETYDQYELVVISVINKQVSAKRLGLYSTRQSRVSLDLFPVEALDIPLDFLMVIKPLMESSDSITEFSDRMIRIAPKSKFDFNYQPLANTIAVRWQSIEYPANYYRDGGTNPSFMGDENYEVSIRWVYDDGDRTPYYPIPGRAPLTGENSLVTGIYSNTYQFENVNGAFITNILNTPIGDGGYTIAEGVMGYHETDELYPINQPLVWGSLCGKKKRLHKFPERSLSTRTNIYSDTSISGQINGPVIRVLAIVVRNIPRPLDNNANPIPGIVGYELFRSSREGNRTIIAKGIINNTFNYLSSGQSFVYPNYPYNSLEPDPFISTTPTTTNNVGQVINLNYNTSYNQNLFTFHSPDTNFTKPFLGARELKLDGIIHGNSTLNFYEPEKHPKHKLLTNAAVLIAAISGLGIAITKLVGEVTKRAISPNIQGSGATLTIAGLAQLAISLAAQNFLVTKFNDIEDTYNTYGGLVAARQNLSDNDVEGFEQSDRTKFSAANILGGLTGGTRERSVRGGFNNAIGKFFRSFGDMGSPGISVIFTQYWGQGVEEALELTYNLSQFQQYGLQQISHCFYNGYNQAPSSRYLLKDAAYLGQGFQDFDNRRINNLYRQSSVILDTVVNVPNTETVNAGLKDTSKQTLQTISAITGGVHDEPTLVQYSTKASSYYASLKLRLRNQYGQAAKQVPIGCVIPVDAVTLTFTSPVIFGGDIYITRYTEKNTMPFFYEWLYGQPDMFEYDYYQRRMLPYPAYWMNTRKYDKGDLTRGFATGLGGSISGLLTGNTQSIAGFNFGGESVANALFSGSSAATNSDPDANFATSGWLPSQFSALDRVGDNTFVQNQNIKNSLFVTKDAYMYLFNSGVMDFYVESEVNLGYRDWEDNIQKRHYDALLFTDVQRMFSANPDVIKADNYYRYDYSLSASKSFVNYASWAQPQSTIYNPIIAENCFIYNPKTILYSLPIHFENNSNSRIVDFWRVFLANNYRDFRADVTTLKSLGLSAAMIFFKTESPLLIQGSDELTTGGGTVITIGTGEFLSRPAQNLTNADRPYQYGSCRDSRSIVNTPSGTFFISQDQGKIFSIAGNGLMNIVMPEMNWWFAKYLQYSLLKDFPNYALLDNPVVGIGCQTSYDNENQIVYFTKTDFLFDPSALPINFTIEYVPAEGRLALKFSGIIVTYIDLRNSNFFKEISWTISYDLKEKTWLSNHDWIPDLPMPSKNTFNTIKGSGIWRHNERCDLFCNYYGVDFPFEIEYENSTGLQVNTLESVEYYLEVYKYGVNCVDRYLELNENYDEAIISNNEQVSGLLKLSLATDNPFDNLNYPIHGLNSVQVLYSRVENKYRINMFYDLTADRGESSFARRVPWVTEDNGYVKSLNPLNLDYQKDPLQRKMFRGPTCSVFLRKKVCGDKKFLMIFAVNKNLESKR